MDAAKQGSWVWGVERLNGRGRWFCAAVATDVRCRRSRSARTAGTRDRRPVRAIWGWRSAHRLVIAGGGRRPRCAPPVAKPDRAGAGGTPDGPPPCSTRWPGSIDDPSGAGLPEGRRERSTKRPARAGRRGGEATHERPAVATGAEASRSSGGSVTASWMSSRCRGTRSATPCGARALALEQRRELRGSGRCRAELADLAA